MLHNSSSRSHTHCAYKSTYTDNASVWLIQYSNSQLACTHLPLPLASNILLYQCETYQLCPKCKLQLTPWFQLIRVPFRLDPGLTWIAIRVSGSSGSVILSQFQLWSTHRVTIYKVHASKFTIFQRTHSCKPQ